MILQILCVPGIVGFTVALDTVGEIPTTEVEIGFGVTTRSVEVRHTDPAEGFGVSTIETTTPLRTVKETVLGRLDVLAHETLGPRDGTRTDFPHPHTSLGNAGDLEIVDVGLVVAPRHRENLTDLDVVGIRFVTVVFAHYGYNIPKFVVIVNTVFLRNNDELEATDGRIPLVPPFLALLLTINLGPTVRIEGVYIAGEVVTLEEIGIVGFRPTGENDLLAIVSSEGVAHTDRALGLFVNQYELHVEINIPKNRSVVKRLASKS